MILNDKQIREAIAEGLLKIEPFDERQIEAASVDLRIGKQGATTTKRTLLNLEKDGFMVLEPGDSGVVLTYEILELSPKHTARFGLRSKYARKGIIATTGLQIDPGFRGRLIIGVTNLTPTAIVLPYCDDLISVEFHELTHPAEFPYEGPYQNKTELVAADIEHIIASDGFHLAEVITSIQALSKNVGTLSTEMKTLKWLIPVAVGFIAILTVLIQLLVTVLAK